MDLTVVKKFGLNEKGKGIITFCTVCVFVCMVIALFLFFDSAPKIFDYGFKFCSDSTKSKFICALLLFIVPILCLPRNMAIRNICVCKEKIYGDLGTGQTKKQIELAIDEVLSATGFSDGTVIIHSVKGDFTFYHIEQSKLCATLINTLKKERYDQKISQQSTNQNVPSNSLETCAPRFFDQNPTEQTPNHPTQPLYADALASSLDEHSGYTPVANPGKGLAVTSLILGIASFFCTPAITGILAMIFGAVARNKGFVGGMATAGMICGALGVISWLIMLVAFPNWIDSFLSLLS